MIDTGSPSGSPENGVLYLVATPIGNIEDITFRALKVLKSADIIVAEDTRRTGILLKYYEINKTGSPDSSPLLSFNDNNTVERTPKIIKELQAGKAIAFVSDSGTPSISDPGFYLVREAIKYGIKVTAIPGPSAVTAGLIISGFPTDRFVFEGFLSRQGGKRKRKLAELINEPRTIVFFEAPHRLIDFLKDCLEILGDREIAIIRELTKKFETIKRGKISELIDFYSHNTPKGEFVIVIGKNV